MVTICLNDLAKGRKGFRCKGENRYGFDLFHCYRRRLKWCSSIIFCCVSRSDRKVCCRTESLCAMDSYAFDTTIRIYGKLYVRVGDRYVCIQCKEVPSMRTKLDRGQNLCPVDGIAIWYLVFATQSVEFTALWEVALKMCRVNLDCS